jgi:hypothetical protein
MSGDIHAHAQRLVARERMEGLSMADGDWLRRHLQACAECSEYAASTDRSLRALRGVSVRLDPSLVRRSQLRVRLRAQEIRERQPRVWALWASFVISWMLGAASSPFVWRGFEWIGRHAGVPNLIWQVGFVLWWAIPALAAAGIVLATGRSRAERERPWRAGHSMSER